MKRKQDLKYFNHYIIYGTERKGYLTSYYTIIKFILKYNKELSFWWFRFIP